MTDELRAAALLVKGSAEEWIETQDANDFDPDDMALWRAQVTLADVVLAARPADDAEPVTEEWLRGIGFKSDQIHECLSKNLSLGNAIHRWRQPDVWWISSRNGDKVFIDPPTTRGCVRCLLVALRATP